MPTQEDNKVVATYPSKMPLWQWIVIYILVGAIIYGLFYSFVTYKNTKKLSMNQPAENPASLVPEVNVDKNIAEIELTDEGFTPDTLTLTPGTKVVWTNKMDRVATVNSSMHPTHEDYPPLNLGEFGPGAKLELTFTEVGEYKYHNHLEPTQFGAINVIEDYDEGSLEE